MYIYKNNNINNEFRVRFGIQGQHQGPLLALNIRQIELAKTKDEEVKQEMQKVGSDKSILPPGTNKWPRVGKYIHNNKQHSVQKCEPDKRSNR